MVDEFLGIEDNVSGTRLAIREDNFFVEDGTFSECGLIEHIAQSAAARMGHIFSTQGKAVPLGYIGAVNDFVLFKPLHVGDVVETKITVLHEVFNITLIEAVTYAGDDKVASCRMKIFLDESEV